VIKFGTPVRAGVEGHLPQLVQALEQDQRLDALWLFGSRARGEADALSDVDLAALARPDLTQAQIWDCQLEWTRRATLELGTDEVLVQPLNGTPVALRHAILRDARLLWTRCPERVADFWAFTLKQYLDFKPHLDRYDRETLRQAASGELR
jgi:predicted nucleotidyltransferase